MTNERLTRDQAVEVRETLTMARQKLVLYRQNHSGEYLGGMEFTALLKRIDHAIALLPIPPPSSGG